MLSIAGREDVTGRLSAAVEAELARVEARPCPELPVHSPGSAVDALREYLVEARAWVLGLSSEGLAVRVPRLLRPLARVMLMPLRLLGGPQRRFNRAVLASLEALHHHLETQEARS